MTNLKDPVYVAQGLSFLPPVLTVDYTHRRSNVRETITEILVVDLGELSIVSPYLIVSVLRSIVAPNITLMLIHKGANCHKRLGYLRTFPDSLWS